jgi:50S ribosomal protein L16 3-hydroxylase
VSGAAGSSQATATDAVPARFLAETWQQAPALLEGLAAGWARKRDWVRRFEAWARPPAIARLFVLADDEGPGRASAAMMPDPRRAYELFRAYADEGQALTLLLNGVEQVDPEIAELRDGFEIGSSWRHDDVVATLSTVGSGIGFHAGHEDSLIVQLAGAREWRLWGPEVVPAAHRNALVWKHSEPHTTLLTRPSAEPLLASGLASGDVLYLPSLFPHEGRTLELSVSLSVAWRGVSAAALLERAGAMSDGDRSIVDEHPDAFLRLIRDPPADDPDAVEGVMEQLEPALDALACTGQHRRRLRQSVAALLSS